MTTASAANATMMQLTAREITDEESLRTINLGGICVWLDNDGVAIAVDVPPFWKLQIIGAGKPN